GVVEGEEDRGGKRRMEQVPVVTQVPVEHLFDMHVGLQSAQAIPTALGARMTFITTGGRVEGPRLRGEILPGGGDWLQVGSDAVGRVDARATLRTHDGCLIHYEARGVIKIPPDGLASLPAREALPLAPPHFPSPPPLHTSA